jgi:protease secretion system outer membrane protein
MIMGDILNRRLFAFALTTPLLLSSGYASAMGLLEAYEAALNNDPTYRSAVHENEAGQEYRALGRSNLLPNLSASYSNSNNRTDITAPNFLGVASTSHPDYMSKSSVVQLRQPLFNLDGWARYKQGGVQADLSEAVFSGRTQDVAVRLVSAYADAKYAEDQLALVTAQRDSYAEQKHVNERMFEKGEGTKTDMLETQAKFDVAEAQVIEAQDNVVTNRNALAALVGGEVTQLDSLTEDFHIKPMQPATYDDWKKIALENNTDLIAQRLSVDATKLDILKNRAGHAPRLDFVAVYDKSESETINTLGQDSTVRSVGFQLNIPLYSGGSVNAGVRQAIANHEKAKSDLDAKTSQVLLDLRKQYNQIVVSMTRLDALLKSVNSSSELVEATRQSIKGGVRINLDLLNAQQQLYAARRDLAQARYTYILAYLRLRSFAGILRADDLQTLATYFVPSK